MAQLATVAIIVNQSKEFYTSERAMQLFEKTCRGKLSPDLMELLKKGFFALLKMSPEEIMEVMKKAKD